VRTLKEALGARLTFGARLTVGVMCGGRVDRGIFKKNNQIDLEAHRTSDAIARFEVMGVGVPQV